MKLIIVEAISKVKRPSFRDLIPAAQKVKVTGVKTLWKRQTPLSLVVRNEREIPDFGRVIGDVSLPFDMTLTFLKWLLFILLWLGFSQLQAQTVLGQWKTIDDETNEPKSIVEIFEHGGKVYGRIVKLFRKPNEDQDPICDECDEEDPRYKKKVIGMEILKDMVKDGDEYSSGEILDPNNGKVYRCKIWLEGSDLKLRGYIGPFFRTQTWIKPK